MRKTIIKTAFLIAFAITISIAVAGETFTFNFQGRLSDTSGNPVPNGNYQMTFQIYSDSIGGTALWSEIHSAVSVSGGYFAIELGSVNPCSLSIPSLQSIYLATQIGTEAPMVRRFKITNSPQTGVTRRLYGDLQTSPGSLIVVQDEVKMIEMTSSSGAGGQASMVMFNPQPEPPGNDPLIELTAGAGGSTGFRLNNPRTTDPIDDGRAFEVSNNPTSGASMVMFNPQPEPPGVDPLIELTAGVGGSTGFVLNNPRTTEPFDDGRAFELSNNPTSGASMVMFNPQPEPPGVDPLIVLESDADGTAGFKLYNPKTTDPFDEKVFEVTNNPAGGAIMRFLSDGSEYMGIEPSPWHPGGDLTMSDPTGGQTLILSSAGTISIGTSATTNILTVQQYSSTDPIADGWTTYSSRRWKTNIETIREPLSKILALRGVSYDWIANGRHDIGLIAEEVGEVIPEVVVYEKNGVDAQSIDYARLVAVLIEAVKEQQRTISDLETDLGRLKAMFELIANSQDMRDKVENINFAKPGK